VIGAIPFYLFVKEFKNTKLLGSFLFLKSNEKANIVLVLLQNSVI
jgi:hypothetical protein